MISENVHFFVLLKYRKRMLFDLADKKSSMLKVECCATKLDGIMTSTLNSLSVSLKKIGNRLLQFKYTMPLNNRKNRNREAKNVELITSAGK